MPTYGEMKTARQQVRTATAKDRVRPTPSQIAHGLIVVPSVFKDDHKNVNWKDFTVVFMGGDLGRKHLDQDNRLRLPLRSAVAEGEELALSIQGGALHIEKAAGDRLSPA